MGAYRVFSHVDSSCRCQSGYDSVDEQGTSRGQESGREDCTPLVFARCEQANRTRGPDGQCVGLTDCSEACGARGGIRSEVLGVCTCAGDLGVDNVCNQHCRKGAAQLTLDGPTVTITDAAGNTETKDLTDFGDVYGEPACSAGNCTVRSAAQDPSGAFAGGYGPPPLIAQGSELLAARRRNLQQAGLSPRGLQDAGADAATVQNPVYCLAADDSFMFTISDPEHYPVYLRDSVMNTNPDFDYGAFLDLASEMKKKKAVGNTAPSLFTFTFTAQGAYVFVDAASRGKMMLVTVMGAGEACADPDRFLQSISGSSLSQFGIPQRADIIIGPDYGLLASLGCILVLSTGTVMVLIAYCLHKQWTIQKVRRQGYRSEHLYVDIGHDNPKTYGKAGSDFVQHKSRPDEESSGEEDDLDGVNMDIYQDLVEAGKQFLEVYETVRNQRKTQQKGKRRQLVELLKELSHEIGAVGQEARGNSMQVFDPAELEDAAAGVVDNEKAQERAEKARQLQEERETRERAAEQAQKDKLDKECSQRDKDSMEALRNAVAQKVQ